MKMLLASSGGVGGLRLQGPLETNDLEPGLAEQARRLVELAQSATGPEPVASRAVPDSLEYELTWFVEEEPGREVARHRRFREGTTPPDALEALRSLMKEVVRRRAAGRASRPRD